MFVPRKNEIVSPGVGVVQMLALHRRKNVIGRSSEGVDKAQIIALY